MNNILEFSGDKMIHYKRSYFSVVENVEDNSSLYMDYLTNYFKSVRKKCNKMQEVSSADIDEIIKLIKSNIADCLKEEIFLKSNISQLILMELEKFEKSDDPRNTIVRSYIQKDMGRIENNSIKDNILLLCKYCFEGTNIAYNGELDISSFLNNYNKFTSAKRKYIAEKTHRVCFNLNGEILTQAKINNFLTIIKNIKESGVKIRSIAISKGNENIVLNDIDKPFEKQLCYNYSNEELDIFKSFRDQYDTLYNNDAIIGFCEYDTMDRTPFSLQDVKMLNLFFDNIIKKAEKCKMTPLEKLMFYYQNVCSLYYASCDGVIKPRDLMSIFKSGNIVCVGFAKFFKELVDRSNDENLKAGFLLVSCHESSNHENHIVNHISIKDKKYHIDGNYFCDPTFDTIRYKKKLNSLTEFLLPIEDLSNKANKNFNIIDSIPITQLSFGCNSRMIMGTDYNNIKFVNKYKNLNNPISCCTIKKCYKNILIKQGVDEIIANNQAEEVMDNTISTAAVYYNEYALNDYRREVMVWRLQHVSNPYVKHNTKVFYSEKLDSNIKFFKQICGNNFEPVIEEPKISLFDDINSIIKKYTTKSPLTATKPAVEKIPDFFDMKQFDEKNIEQQNCESKKNDDGRQG